eukprot:COSAG05_NODE_14791_length_387_cov_0.666667_1_plen_37_part_01
MLHVPYMHVGVAVGTALCSVRKVEKRTAKGSVQKIWR